WCSANTTRMSPRPRPRCRPRASVKVPQSSCGAQPRTGH
ncbi:MAG: hypothetical protein AVDCRST_MAG76-1259, partial [uncultured Acidimicrobiales bacterium]